MEQGICLEICEEIEINNVLERDGHSPTPETSFGYIRSVLKHSAKVRYKSTVILLARRFLFLVLLFIIAIVRLTFLSDNKRIINKNRSPVTEFFPHRMSRSLHQSVTFQYTYTYIKTLSITPHSRVLLCKMNSSGKEVAVKIADLRQVPKFPLHIYFRSVIICSLY